MEEVKMTLLEQDQLQGAVLYTLDCNLCDHEESRNENLNGNGECEANVTGWDRIDASGWDTPQETIEEDHYLGHRENYVASGRLFEMAVTEHDWDHAKRFMPRVGFQRLNDGLCTALDSIWFLSTRPDLTAATQLIEGLILGGANDFTRAVLRTSFLASCVWACRSCTMSLADNLRTIAQRLQERLRECNGDEILKAEAAAKVQRFTEWALKCIGLRAQGTEANLATACRYTMAVVPRSDIESEFQLKAFKRFLMLAGSRLTKKDYTEAFDAACFPLILFSSAIDPGWASGIAASTVQGLLGVLVEGGANNVNQCFLEASRFGSTALVRILLQVSNLLYNLEMDDGWVMHNIAKLHLPLTLGRRIIRPRTGNKHVVILKK